MAETDQQDAGTAGVIMRPPLLYLACLGIGLILDYLVPLPFSLLGSGVVSWAAGGSLILAGLATAVVAFRNFSRAGTPVPTNRPVRSLVTSGIHGWTRNPIYVGMFAIYIGIGLALPSPWILVLTVPLAIIMRYGVVAREEAYLGRRFGVAYHDYQTRVRRWL